MDKHLNNSKKEILWGLLANPVSNGHSHAVSLESMVSDFPQSGLLHALLSYVNGGQNRTSAVVYLNPKILYAILNIPEGLPILNSSDIIQQNHHHIREDELVTETLSFELAEFPGGIDTENIRISTIATPGDEVIAQGKTFIVDERATPEANTSFTEPTAQRTRPLNIDDETEKLIVNNIAATDYFVFDKAVNDRKPVETTESNLFIKAEETESTKATTIDTEENQEVSKYNDDTLPYTFLWWLNKTRNEHARIYQPFKLDTSQAIRHMGADELQHQYYENIFHLSSVDELDRSTTHQPIEFDPKNKEDLLIKRFIIEEPHINTPSADKLDTENKARKSAEDQDELVTETLAQVYIDQMLYKKAIATYKKLILKFPEKSRYFANQIEQLKRKTN